MMSNKAYILILTAVITTFLASCGSMKNTATVHRTSKGGTGGDSRTFEIPSSLPPQSHALLREAKSWIGTPYKYGGEDKRGVDCSGLVLNVYRSALDIKLPRSSREQSSYCSPLAKDKLMPGDLLFFATSGSKRVSHVGIYVGDGKMVHSSTSKGVIVSSISDNYYVRTYAGAGAVDKYRDMLKKEKMPTLNNRTEIPAPIPTERKVQEEMKKRDNKKAAPKAVKSISLDRLTAVKTDSVAKSPEPTPDEARESVLNSLIEQKLDSIFTQQYLE